MNTMIKISGLKNSHNDMISWKLINEGNVYFVSDCEHQNYFKQHFSLLGIFTVLYKYVDYFMNKAVLQE